MMYANCPNLMVTVLYTCNFACTNMHCVPEPNFMHTKIRACKYQICQARETDNSLSFWAIFCSFNPLKTLKIKFGKIQKNVWIYNPFTNVHHKWRSYDAWFLRYKVEQTEFFVFLGHFLPFDPPNNQKNQNFDKTKQNAGDIIIWHLCTTNDNYMMHGSWDMKHDRQNFLSFWVLFCPFTLLTTQKIKILKKWKPHLEISSPYRSVPKIMIICCTVTEIWLMTHVICNFHFGLFFAL